MSKEVQCKNCPQLRDGWECAGDFTRVSFKREEIQNDIIEALKLLYKNDKYLLVVKANEVCISSRFYAYFEQLFGKKYNNLNIDPEYNRNGETSKYYEEYNNKKEHRYAKPDMIIHKRNCNFHNKVFIEFKPYWNDDASQDYKKLVAFTSPYKLFIYKGISYSYKYEYGVSILLDLERVCFNWIKNGEIQPFHDEEVNVENWNLLVK